MLVISGALLTALFAQIAIQVAGLAGADHRPDARRRPGRRDARRPRRGMASMALYALLGLFLPFYADGDSGWDVIWGASGGYIVGFIFAAGIIGWIAEHGADRNVVLAFLAFVVRPAHDLRVRPRRAEDRGRRVLGLDDPQRVHDLHRRRAREGGDRRHRAAVGVGGLCGGSNADVELLARYVGNLAALWVASEMFDEMTYGDEFGVLALAALVFTVANWIVKPIVTLLAIPLIILTLGVAYFFVNVLMLLLTDWVVADFEAGGFWTLVGATIVIWLVNVVISAAVHDVQRSARAAPRVSPPARRRAARGERSPSPSRGRSTRGRPPAAGRSASS